MTGEIRTLSNSRPAHRSYDLLIAAHAQHLQAVW
jgi:hypothetical protein